MCASVGNYFHVVQCFAQPSSFLMTVASTKKSVYECVKKSLSEPSIDFVHLARRFIVIPFNWFSILYRSIFLFIVYYFDLNNKKRIIYRIPLSRFFLERAFIIIFLHVCISFFTAKEKDYKVIVVTNLSLHSIL